MPGKERKTNKRHKTQIYCLQSGQFTCVVAQGKTKMWLIFSNKKQMVCMQNSWLAEWVSDSLTWKVKITGVRLSLKSLTRSDRKSTNCDEYQTDETFFWNEIHLMQRWLSAAFHSFDPFEERRTDLLMVFWMQFLFNHTERRWIQIQIQIQIFKCIDIQSESLPILNATADFRR